MDFGSRASIELVFTDVDFCHDFGSYSEHDYFFEKWSIQLVDAMVLWNMYVVIIDGVDVVSKRRRELYTVNTSTRPLVLDTYDCAKDILGRTSNDVLTAHYSGR